MTRELLIHSCFDGRSSGFASSAEAPYHTSATDRTVAFHLFVRVTAVVYSPGLSPCSVLHIKSALLIVVFMIAFILYENQDLIVSFKIGDYNIIL